MANKQRTHRKTAKIPLLLIVVLLLGSSVLAQSTWWRNLGQSAQVAEKVWLTNEGTPSESNLGYGLISSPVSLGTDNFYMISSPDHFKEGVMTAREYKTHKIEYNKGNFIEREIADSNQAKIYYLDSFDNGYVLCTNKQPTIVPPAPNYCRSQRDTKMTGSLFGSFTAIPNIQSILDNTVNHAKYRSGVG